MKASEIPFTFIGNNLAIDFTNTEIMTRGRLVDLLHDNADLVRWLNAAELSIDRKKLKSSDLAHALELRKALKEIFTAMIDDLPMPKTALSTLNKYLAQHTPQQILHYDEGGYVLQSAQNSMLPSMILGRLAYEGAQLLASPQAQQLKHCTNPDCVLIFLDTSRSRKRRWCSMETCGNRAKVATHYRKYTSNE